MKTFRKVFRVIISIAMLVIIGIAGYNICIKYLYPIEYEELAEKYSEEYGVDKALVLAVIKCESKFDPDAKSDKNAVGLMQLTEGTFEDVRKMVGDDESVTFENMANDPETNIRYGAKYLQYLLQEFGGDKTASIAAYNAGLNNVKKWLGNDEALNIENIEFSETKAYVEKVLEAEENYKKIIDED